MSNGSMVLRRKRFSSGAGQLPSGKPETSDPNRPESDIVSPEAEDSWWDWVETDECIEKRRFPSVALAKAWASRNSRLDYTGMPRIYKNEWRDWDQSEDEAETTVELEYQGEGHWLDLKTGQLL